MTDIPGDASTTASISVGGTFDGSLETLGDHDWIAVTLNAGQPVTITVDGVTLADPYLYIRDSSGSVLFENDDISTGVDRNSRVAFNPGYSGTYFIDVAAFGNAGSGSYKVSVQPYTAPGSGTIDQIANQLTTGFWNGDGHHFDVTQGGTITVNISSLNPDEKALARAALAEWTDLIGVHFQEVSSGEQILFDDSEGSTGSTAATSAVWSGGITSSAHIQISSSWLQTYGTGLDSYSFQTYVHEIGHALGLGHAGNYNGDARYPYDAMFSNDAWPLSVMSYFDTTDNTSYGYSANFVLTPMAADIVAMQSLYGLSTTTRTGDTIYGFHSNAGGIYDASLYPSASYAIFDSGGTDTLDFSGSPYNQQINLNPETFSSFNGHILDIYIARGVVVENAIGGSADDTIIQNGANNVLAGGAGDDTVSYETATAGVVVDLRITTQQNTGGAGLDTLSGFEHLIGSAYADILIAGAATGSLVGGAGNDRIDAGAANAPGGLGMYGGDGDDVLILRGPSETWVDGGSGFNILDCSAATAGVILITNGHVGAGIDTLINIQEIIGSSYGDSLYAWNVGDTLLAGAGNDLLTSSMGQAHLAGGSGDDRYEVWTSTDQITENAGEGSDTVVARASYALGANLENLILYETISSDPYAGAALPPPGGVPENWTGTGNDLTNVITGNAGTNALSGLGGNDTLTGGGGADTLTGGAGNDTFLDTKAGLTGDTITDFAAGDKIVISDANLAAFSFSLTGHTLAFTGGSLTLTVVPLGTLVASAAANGGVQLTIEGRAVHDDFNGDGRSDVLWQNDNGTVRDWLAQPGGSFAGNTANVNFVAAEGSHIIGTGDFDGDGRADMLWQTFDGVVIDILGHADGFIDNSTKVNIRTGTDWHVVGTGDFNGDGRDDVLWQNDNGTVRDWLGQADASFAGNIDKVNILTGPDWHVIGTGDFNGDGVSDVLWQNDNGTVRDWLGQSDGSFVGNIDKVNILTGPDWHAIGTGDFNGDGLSDVLWRNVNGTIREWLGQRDGTFVGNIDHVNFVPAAGQHVVGIGDYNGDAIDDLLWSNNGTITESLGRPDGSFVDNSANVSVATGTDWHVQDPFVHDLLA